MPACILTPSSGQPPETPLPGRTCKAWQNVQNHMTPRRHNIFPDIDKSLPFFIGPLNNTLRARFRGKPGPNVNTRYFSLRFLKVFGPLSRHNWSIYCNGHLSSRHGDGIFCDRENDRKPGHDQCRKNRLPSPGFCTRRAKPISITPRPPCHPPRPPTTTCRTWAPCPYPGARDTLRQMRRCPLLAPKEAARRPLHTGAPTRPWTTGRTS